MAVLVLKRSSGASGKLMANTVERGVQLHQADEQVGSEPWTGHWRSGKFADLRNHSGMV
jgi:hypothetical protein